MRLDATEALLAGNPPHSRPSRRGGAGSARPPRHLCIPACALLTGPPVKWIEDRREHFLTTDQERDQYWEGELALNGDGQLLGLRGTLLHDTGAYVPWGLVVPHICAATVPGPYVLRACRMDVSVVYRERPGALRRRHRLDAGHPGVAARPNRRRPRLNGGDSIAMSRPHGR